MHSSTLSHLRQRIPAVMETRAHGHVSAPGNPCRRLDPHLRRRSKAAYTGSRSPSMYKVTHKGRLSANDGSTVTAGR